MLKLAGITQGRKQVNKGITGGCLVINQNQRSRVGNTTSFLFIIWQIDQAERSGGILKAIASSHAASGITR